MEVITKTPEDMIGVRYVIEGGREKSLEEIGAPKWHYYAGAESVLQHPLPGRNF